MHRMRKNDIVFGSGILSEKDIPEKQNISNKIKAVRGPLTRNLLLQLGANCNEVYGDPALLLPFIIKKPIISKKYKIGIIPHYLDYDNPLLEKFKNKKDVLIINILSSYEPEKFINNISMCEVIYSSSLHGVIVGDAYGIPSYHILISDKVLGNNFKFNDYFASVNRKYINIKLTENTTVSTLIENIENYKPIINLKKLIYNFPFIDKKIKKSSMEMLDDGFMNYIHGESSLHY